MDEVPSYVILLNLVVSLLSLSYVEQSNETLLFQVIMVGLSLTILKKNLSHEALLSALLFALLTALSFASRSTDQ